MSRDWLKHLYIYDIIKKISIVTKNCIRKEDDYMAKVILICGKIASGKSYYAKQLKNKENAIILNTDELTYAMFDNEQGENYMQLAERANNYLMKKTVEIVNAGCNVILDWGFWQNYNRRYMTEFFRAKGINIEWHYISISDKLWDKNIEERNKKIDKGHNKEEFYVTEELKNKVLSLFEEPNKNEIDVWYEFKR